MTARELILVDERVEGWESLIAGTNPDIPVLLLPRTGDGLAALATALSGFQQLQTLHLVSHGRDGSLLLGGALVDSAALARGHAQLAAISSHLASGADVLLYGCRVAADETGRNFITLLADALQADVAASNDTTGAAALGGDWDLEFSVGQVEFKLPFTPAGLQAGQRLMSYSSSSPTSGSTTSSTVTSGSNILVGADPELPNNLENENPSIQIIEGRGGDDTLVGFSGDAELQVTDVLDETLRGGEGNDSLDGKGGNDFLDGGSGADTMVGGLGADVFFVDDESDAVLEDAGDGENRDAVRTNISFALPDNVEDLELLGLDALEAQGNALANFIIGSDADNFINGGVGADTMEGGNGNDTYVVDSTSDVLVEEPESDVPLEPDEFPATQPPPSPGRNDRAFAQITFTLPDHVEELLLGGRANLEGTGNASDNLLVGNAGANKLTGLAGADTLIGGDGKDTLTGGEGSDTYVIGTGDSIDETGATPEDVDTVISLTTFTLASSLENLILTGAGALSGTGNANANMMEGNDGANTLAGLAGNDTLDGGEGADSLDGGTGNDTYVVDNTLDVIKAESSKTDVDSVKSAITFTLATNLEHLTLTGVEPISGTGNAAANRLTGNYGVNVLTGLGGNDTLAGGGAYDGRDTLIGGDGNDEYWVSVYHREVITETATATSGRDRVYVESDDFGSFLYVLPANVEDGQLVASEFQYGLAGGTLRGNSLANVLFSSSLRETLDGSTGTDTVSYAFANKGVKVNLGCATTQDTGFGVDILRNFENLTGSDFNDSLRGNGLANVITGGKGKDLLAGGGGNDIFDFNAATESGAAFNKLDSVLDFNTGDKLDLSGIDANTGTATNDAFTLLSSISSITSASSLFGASPAAGTLRFVTGTGVLYGNTDTDAAPEFAIALVGVTSLTSAALVL